jgi:hypothetical protein
MKKDISLRHDKRERAFAKWSILHLICMLTVAYLITPSTAFGQCWGVLDGCTLSPPSTTLAVGETHELVATCCENDRPMPPEKIDFEIEGPNYSSSGSAITDASTGIASFTYQGTQEGEDTITAKTSKYTSNNATATWTQESEPPITIKTGPTKLNVNSQGVLPMIVFGTEAFDVQTIDPSSLLLNGAVSPLMHAYEDAGSKSGEPDGFIDLTLKFDLQEIVETLGDTPSDGKTVTLVLTGSLYNTVSVTQTARTATTIRAEQNVEIMNKGKEKKGK